MEPAWRSWALLAAMLLGVGGLTAGCVLPGGGGTGPTITIPPPLLVTVPPVSIAACIGGSTGTALCRGSSTVTVRNLGLIATSVAPVLSVTGNGATIDQGTCSSGPLAAGASCTATLSISLTVPVHETASTSGTVSAIAGAAAGRANFTTTS